MVIFSAHLIMNLQQLLPTGLTVRAELAFLSDCWNGFLVEAGFDI
jgi:hypothetical protein